MTLKAVAAKALTPNRHARDPITDEELVTRIRAGEMRLMELVMRRYNQRLFRIARGILHDDGEAEDIVQDTYIRAYRHLHEFRGPLGFGGWLCRIAVNQSLMRARRADWQARRPASTQPDDNGQETTMPRQAESTSPTPEQDAYRHQIRALLEQAIDTLPETYRIAFMMREVEQMSVHETAACLDIEPTTVKTRVYRAKRQLRRTLNKRVQAATSEVFGFAGHRCDRIVARVFERLADDSGVTD